MVDAEMESLQEELKAFREEKEKIRGIVGQIGGTGSRRRDLIVNVAFIGGIATLLCMDVLRYVLEMDLWLPGMFSLELGVLLVSVKIIWMIHKQAKVEHFQFWILNSIEFRLTDMSKRIRGIEDRLK